MTLLLLIQIESKQEQILTTNQFSNIVTITTAAPHELEIGDLTTFENAGSFSSPDTELCSSRL
jgi:hypothetical protein